MTTATPRLRSAFIFADDRYLLAVLLAEVGAVGAGDGEQLGYYRCYAAKVAGTGRAFHALGYCAGFNPGVKPVGIDFGRRRGEHQVGALRLQQLQVSLEGARVGGEVLVGSELRRVDEYGGGHGGVVRPRLPGEGEVTFVERAHGGNQAEGAWGGAAEGGHFGGGGDDLHDEYSSARVGARHASPLRG